ncbi:MAG: Na+/H+ antiporter NhaA [Deltaproteobacteria bacterium]|nr:MAG: Na+/H+ antiporter NhaA [Deltaproteobacteria bacterium]
MRDLVTTFAQLESAGGMVLVLATVLALWFSNSGWAFWYTWFLGIPVQVSVGQLILAKPLILWINDGLMAIFFLLVGLEIKRELLEGQLASFRQLLFPSVGALGGMVVPALIYALVNWGDPLALHGWAIPMATDIAFALGVLTLFGQRVPGSLKFFLLTLAIMDDIGAIIVIALFYSDALSLVSIALASGFIGVLFAMNVLGITKIRAYMIVGVLLWICVLKSGIHATLAGVVIAFAIPLRVKKGEHSPARHLEHLLHPWSNFFVLPLFAFANAGISLAGMGLDSIFHPVPLGIVAGLFIGKQAGVFGWLYLGVRWGLIHMPQGLSWKMIYGVAILCGVGFTMSLFIGSLAFEMEGCPLCVSINRVGTMLGSLLSCVVGMMVLYRVLPRRQG